ncbi:hypothetical protein [Clostridium tagluense]|uniref:hypothetical protein n=1 Tax=Clostridium tagluense TaxID=360422 RepID=UPI001CF186C9|nr:hypothetical protein [Clostridium tagluense]MCB2300432.1 hypothetical protein [Clostridium tagluense]
MIFLYNFEIKGNGIDFVLNEGLAKDMYSDLEIHLRALVKSTVAILLDYRYLSSSNIIFSAKVLDNDELELLFSKGLGQYIDERAKNVLYECGKAIANICAEVMQRRTLEEKS